MSLNAPRRNEIRTAHFVRDMNTISMQLGMGWPLKMCTLTI